MDHTCLTFGNLKTVLHWNFRGFTEFPLDLMKGRNNSENVTDLYLKENRITRIPTDLFKLRSLESLYLCGNEIRHVPTEIALLKTLKCLDISGNCVRYLPEEFGDLENLKYCFLDDNQITELPITLNRLKNLRYLSVCDNHLTWLAQKPVYNCYLCEFKFWRNKQLNHVPYHIWLTILMSRPRCIIGCFEYRSIREDHLLQRNIIRIHNQLCCPNDNIPISFPSGFQVVTVQSAVLTPAPLRELCIRKMYEIVCLDTDRERWENNNIYEEAIKAHGDNRANKISSYLQCLPLILQTEILRGPRLFCDHLKCAKPLFNFAIVDFVKSTVEALDEPKEIILSVTCCSQYCYTKWNLTHMNNYVQPLNWRLITNQEI